MALHETISGQGIAVSYTYTVDTDLDFGKVPLDSNFLNLYNNFIFNKSPIGVITKIGVLSKLALDFIPENVANKTVDLTDNDATHYPSNIAVNNGLQDVEDNAVAYSIALGGI